MTTAFIAYENCLSSSITLPVEMLSAAQDAARVSKSKKATKPNVEIKILGRKRLICCAGNIEVRTIEHPRALTRPQLVFLPAIWRSPLSVLRREKYLLPLLEHWAEQGSRICAVGSSSVLLAEAGLLEQRVATTHWSQMEVFRRRYPEVNLKPDFLITQSDNIFCVSSVNSVADLMIYFIEELFDSSVARRVEGNFSPEVRQPYSSSLFRQGQQTRHTDEDIVRLQHWMQENFRQPANLRRMADMLGISTRSLNRRFKASMDKSPGDYLLQLKVDHAKELLKHSNLSAGEISLECGFNSAAYFSQMFRKTIGMTPVAYRNAVKAKLFSAN